MKQDKAAEAVRAGIDKSVEAPLYPDHRDVETKLLATLATFINSDEADLKYSLLELEVGDFHFRDHRAVFAAMKQLADAGEYVDQVTVRAKVGDAWEETLAGIFGGSKADVGAAETYKRKVCYWSTIKEARQSDCPFRSPWKPPQAPLMLIFRGSSRILRKPCLTSARRIAWYRRSRRKPI